MVVNRLLLLTLYFWRKTSYFNWWLASFKKKLPIDWSICLKKLRTVTGMLIKKTIQSCSTNDQCWEKPKQGFQKPTPSAWRIRKHAFALYTVNFMELCQWKPYLEVNTESNWRLVWQIKVVCFMCTMSSLFFNCFFYLAGFEQHSYIHLKNICLEWGLNMLNMLKML